MDYIQVPFALVAYLLSVGLVMTAVTFFVAGRKASTWVPLAGVGFVVFAVAGGVFIRFFSFAGVAAIAVAIVMAAMWLLYAVKRQSPGLIYIAGAATGGLLLAAAKAYLPVRSVPMQFDCNSGWVETSDPWFSILVALLVVAVAALSIRWVTRSRELSQRARWVLVSIVVLMPLAVLLTAAIFSMFDVHGLGWQGSGQTLMGCVISEVHS